MALASQITGNTEIIQVAEAVAREKGIQRENVIEAIEQAIQAETVVYAIGIGDRRYEGINKDALTNLAEKTGGRAFFPKKESDLTAAFQEIEQELRSQYLLAYSSTNKTRDGKFRAMTIEIANPQLAKDKLKLRYRPGYFAKKDGG